MQADLSDHLFRRESARMVAVLTRIFGVQNLALAEDVVQDAFCRAIEVWKLRGIPENPSAWLMATAKNRALDLLRRERTARTFAPELGRLLSSEWTLAPVVAEAFEPNAIKDDELRVMFSCCHPRLGEEAQVALILHLSCGFSVNEIAAAFMSGPAAIEKRITRAKRMLAGSKKLLDTTNAEDFAARLPAVQRALYLLFNEGYHGASAESAVRKDLCHEAIRLTAQLIEHPQGATPSSYALAAMMCLHAARLPSRLDGGGNLIALFDQDRSKWDRKLIQEGKRLLEFSAKGDSMSEYHVEAAIAAVHCDAANERDTDWKQIVEFYEMLMRIHPSPIVALNRAIAIAYRDGPEQGLQEIQAISDIERLADYPFYFGALGELELRSGNAAVAAKHFGEAARKSRNATEKEFFTRRVAACEEAALK
jgi:RNA polymerase sigma factor (sigma-70 family)